MKKIFAISDVHGHYKEMIDALNNAGFDENNDNHLLIVCGDIFDRGSESVKIYEFLKELTDKGQAIVLRGNHDSMFIDYLDGSTISPFNYLHNGTRETFADFLHRTAPFESWSLLEEHIVQPTGRDFARWLEYARNEINKEYPELLGWLKSLPYYYETKNYIFTHGAIDTKVDDWHNPQCSHYNFKNWEALAWNDGSFFGSNITNTNKTVVIGHFGTKELRKMYPFITENDKGIEYDILVRDDNRVIALDTTTVLSKKVNVLVIDEELIEV